MTANSYTKTVNSVAPSKFGLGMGHIQNASDEEISHIVRRAIVNGINVFDMCAGGKNVFAPVGKAIENVRDHVILTAHFGAGFDELGEYEWIREPERICSTFRDMLSEMGTDHIDIGMLHYVDDEDDWLEMRDSGVLEYMKSLKESGVLHRLGFSTESPSLAMKMLDSGEFDAALISFDDRCDDGMRGALLERCLRENITIMAADAGRGEPFAKTADIPGVTTVVACIKGIDELDEVIEYI